MLFFAVSSLLAQAPPQPGTPAQGSSEDRPASVPSPALPSTRPNIQYVQETHCRSGFLKKFTFESFGYGFSPVEPGFEFRQNLLTGPFDSNMLECPRCLIRSPINRTRYSLPAFGAQGTLHLWHDRTQIVGGFGGINGWRADNTGLETGALSYRRDSSFNDAWLLQFYAGTRVALDRGKHVWIGAHVDHVDNLGNDGPRSWNTLIFSLSFVF